MGAGFELIERASTSDMSEPPLFLVRFYAQTCRSVPEAYAGAF
jgi:hypothetical protein